MSETRTPSRLVGTRPSGWVGAAVSVISVAAATAAIYPLKHLAPTVSLSVVYLPAVLLVSAYWGLVLGLATSRDTKFSAREVVRPAGGYSDPLKMIEDFHHTRAETIAFAAATQAPLRDHFFPHIAFGDLDCCQWLFVIAKHTARHAAQIEQVKADPAYPLS